MTKPDPFRYFKTSREIIRLAVMLYVRFPLSLRNVEDLLHERGIDVSHEAVRYWWHRFGPMFASEIRKRRIEGMKSSRWRWHLDEMFVKINGERHYLWRAVDHEGEVLRERGVDVSHQTVRFWWHRFGPMFASEIRKRRIQGVRSSRWRWHLDEMFVKINGETHYLWRAVDHEGEVLETFVTKTRDKKAALKFLRKAMGKLGQPYVIVTDKLRSYGAALKEHGAFDRLETGRWLNNPAEGDVRENLG